MVISDFSLYHSFLLSFSLSPPLSLLPSSLSFSLSLRSSVPLSLSNKTIPTNTSHPLIPSLRTNLSSLSSTTPLPHPHPTSCRPLPLTCLSPNEFPHPPTLFTPSHPPDTLPPSHALKLAVSTPHALPRPSRLSDNQATKSIGGKWAILGDARELAGSLPVRQMHCYQAL